MNIAQTTANGIGERVKLLRRYDTSNRQRRSGIYVRFSDVIDLVRGLAFVPSVVMDEEMGAICGECGQPLQHVRPGKWQCVNAECLSGGAPSLSRPQLLSMGDECTCVECTKG